jgi:hypothetical protein
MDYYAVYAKNTNTGRVSYPYKTIDKIKALSIRRRY